LSYYKIGTNNEANIGTLLASQEMMVKIKTEVETNQEQMMTAMKGEAKTNQERMEANIEVRVDDNISEIRANNENFEVL
jgi:hypothetical protein